MNGCGVLPITGCCSGANFRFFHLESKGLGPNTKLAGVPQERKKEDNRENIVKRERIMKVKESLIKEK